jgi:hypothetical protein
MMRSKDARTCASCTGDRRDVTRAPREESVVAHPPIAYPAAARVPLARKVRRFMATNLLTFEAGCHEHTVG